MFYFVFRILGFMEKRGAFAVKIIPKNTANFDSLYLQM
jgi:hypothetical protein